jgi:hypothetical protein
MILHFNTNHRIDKTRKTSNSDRFIVFHYDIIKTKTIDETKERHDANDREMKCEDTKVLYKH